ncbi:hypothetical protein W911_02600 [Hyphomicrobium nitrativorans NL23]|uniref:Uncharacterized protein n=1 Tax=Hyphomicrobium nitrativorans NL23 TaxID=1029756 RepID=V5S9Y7_9HYPH|nr:hypothetical protein [Hyphomicrobium nitrativorans]AHB47551.1 hypothetical protein W911_02600 [Hyphomicrobium nitrativorans NL23]
MNTFELLEYAAWSLSAFLGLWMLVDMIRTDRSYEEDLLTSSKEGEIERSPVTDPERERDR